MRNLVIDMFRHREAIKRGGGWSAYERAVRFPDGIVLVKGRVIKRWLPDRSLIERTPQQATDLVRSKLPIETLSP